MWIFAFGSLMWGDWERPFECVRRSRATLNGYRRVFNKASVRNWGNRQNPCPTLNIVESPDERCVGVAFEFSENNRSRVKNYLEGREGKGFEFRNLPISLEDGTTVSAMTAIYTGKDTIVFESNESIASQILIASGQSGRCIGYLEGVQAELRRLGISDPTVTDLLSRLAR